MAVEPTKTGMPSADRGDHRYGHAGLVEFVCGTTGIEGGQACSITNSPPSTSRCWATMSSARVAIMETLAVRRQRVQSRLLLGSGLRRVDDDPHIRAGGMKNVSDEGDRIQTG